MSLDKILLIDGMNAIWRANITFGPPKEHKLVNDRCNCNAPWHMEQNFCYGEKYSLIFNFFRNLRPIIEKFSPDKCFFILEGHPQFRYDLYPDYKANRLEKYASKAMNKVFEHTDLIVKLLMYLPITVCTAAHYECDDVVASLCENLRDEELTILSNDSDYIQLLQKNFSQLQIFDPIKKDFMSAPAYPYVAWKCLAGDKSDNIKKLVTPKKALAYASDPNLFQKFMDIEENRANFSINRQLIEFRTVPAEEIFMEEGIRNFDKLREEFSDMKFESIINDKSWNKYVSTFDCLRF